MARDGLLSIGSDFGQMEDNVLSLLSEVLGIPVPNIDTDATFIRLGGSSLSAVELVSACKEIGVPLTLSTILGQGSISQIFHEAKRTVSEASTTPSNESEISFARTESIASSVSLTATETGHLTEMQLSFLAGSEKHPGVSIIAYYEEYRTQAIPAVKQAWKSVIDNEPVFRAAIDLSEGQGFMYEKPNIPFEWKETVVEDERRYDSELSKPNTRSDVGAWFEVITLNTGNLETSRSTVIWNVHHALVDGYSANIILNKVRNAAQGKEIQQGPSPIRILNDLEAYRIQNMEKGNHFWSDRNSRYSDCVGDIQLHTVTKPGVKLTDVDSCVVKYDAEQLARFALDSGVTVASIHYAAWALLLAVYLDTDSVVFGAVLSGRNLPITDIEKVAASLVNTLPFFVRIDRSQKSHDFVQDVLASLNELAEYQWTTSENGMSRQHSSLLAMQFDYSAAEQSDLSPLNMWSRLQSDIPLSVLIGQKGEVTFQFNPSKFSRRSVCVMADCYVRLCNLLMKSDRILDDCWNEFLPKHHREALMRFGNCFADTTTPRSVKDDLVSLYESTVQAYPDNVAIQKDSIKWTYGEMNEACNALANEIATKTEIGDVVCVYADQSPEWIVAIFAILKSRCVYCPISTASPPDHMRSIYDNSGATLAIAPRPVETLDFARQLITVSTFLKDVARTRVTYIPRGSMNPPSNAYLCFTSGSTGLPKGVMCTHEGLVAFQRDLTVRLLSQPGWKISQVMSPAFDGSIHEIFSALSYGSTLVLPHSSGDPFAHIRDVDSAIFTPSVASVLDPADFPDLTAVYLVGEPVPQAVANKWASQKQLYNMYGPTEFTGGSTIAKLLPNEPVTIGGPNPSSRIYVLNSKQELCPPGVVGELFLAGVQTARGYINRPDETNKRFLKDNVCDHLDSMMYQTGDKGYWNERGEIVLLGRADRQIKLRGFRLDLNDLETRMAQASPAVTSAAVVAVNSQLIALVKPGSVEMATYRKILEEKMPRYQIAQHIIPVDEFPRTAVGKLDYKAIEKMPLSIHTVDKDNPVEALESQIVEVWRDLLGLEDTTHIDGSSNFLDLGGHSLLQLLMTGRLSKLFNITVPPILVIESQSLRDLAAAIGNLRRTQALPLNSRPSGQLGKFEVSPIELEWYEKYELDASSSAFNISLAYAFNPKIIDREKLTEAWNTVLKRHRILRTRYLKQRRGTVKRRYADSPPRVQRVLNVNIWKETHRIFNLTTEDLIRVTISKDKLLVVISHIICDLTSLQILLKEATAVYNGIPLGLVKQEYMETVVWNTSAFPCDLEFWQDYLKDSPLTNNSATPPRNDYRGTTALCQVPVHVFHEMQRLVESTKFSYHQLALAAVGLALQVDSEDMDIVLGGPYLNRRSEKDMNTVGLYLEPLPIRIKYDLASTDSLLETVERTSQTAVAHAIPWSQLLEKMQIEPDFPDHPITDTMVTFHDDRDAEDPLGLDSMQKLLIWTNGAKFKLMVEFTAVSNESLLLRLEYDHTCYTPDDIRKIQDLVITSLLYLALGLPHQKIKSHLRSIKSGITCTTYRQLPFGVSMASL